MAIAVAEVAAAAYLAEAGQGQAGDGMHLQFARRTLLGSGTVLGKGTRLASLAVLLGADAPMRQVMRFISSSCSQVFETLMHASGNESAWLCSVCHTTNEIVLLAGPAVRAAAEAGEEAGALQEAAWPLFLHARLGSTRALERFRNQVLASHACQWHLNIGACHCNAELKYCWVRLVMLPVILHLLSAKAGRLRSG